MSALVVLTVVLATLAWPVERDLTGRNVDRGLHLGDPVLVGRDEAVVGVLLPQHV